MNNDYDIVCAVCGAPDTREEFYYNFAAGNYACSDDCIDDWIESNYDKVAQYYKDRNFN